MTSGYMSSNWNRFGISCTKMSSGVPLGAVLVNCEMDRNTHDIWSTWEMEADQYLKLLGLHDTQPEITHEDAHWAAWAREHARVIEYDTDTERVRITVPYTLSQ